MGSQVVLPRETKEFLPLTVLANGVQTSGFDTSVVRWPLRPTVWVPAAVVDGDAGIILETLTQGTWTVWIRVTTAAEAIVVNAGTVYIQ